MVADIEQTDRPTDLVSVANSAEPTGHPSPWPFADSDDIEEGEEELLRLLDAPWTVPAARRAIGYKAIAAVRERLSGIRINPLPLDGGGKDLRWLCFGPQEEIDAWYAEARHARAITAAVEDWLSRKFLLFGNALASTYPPEDIAEAILSCLDERQRNVLTWRTAGETLEAVASIYGLTRERIRQIEFQARERLAGRVIGLRACHHPAAAMVLRRVERAAMTVFAAACREDGVLRNETCEAWMTRALPECEAAFLRMFRLAADGAPDDLRHLFDPVAEMGHPFQGGRTDLPWTDADVTALAVAFASAASVAGKRNRRWVAMHVVCAASGLTPDGVRKLAGFARMTVQGDAVFEGRLHVADIRRAAISTVLEQADRAMHETEIIRSLIPVGFGTSAPLREVRGALQGDPEAFVSDGKALWQMRKVFGETVEDRRSKHPELPSPWPASLVPARLAEPGRRSAAERGSVLCDLTANNGGFLSSAACRLADALAGLEISERRSLAQVLTPGDELTLLAWLAAPDGSVQLEREAGSNSSARALEGLTALAAFTAVVRTECGSDDAHWEAIRKRCGGGLRSRWFNSQGAPMESLRSAFVEAATEFRLRETFEFVSDPWSTLITLQAGPLRGDIGTLAHALSSGQPTVAMRHLVAPGPNHSASAALLWNVLVQFRRGNVGRGEVNAVASQSEWWPGWSVDEACRACLGKAQVYHPASPQIPEMSAASSIHQPVAPAADRSFRIDQPISVGSRRSTWSEPEVQLARDGGSFLLQLPHFLPVTPGPVALVGSGVREGGDVQEKGAVVWHGRHMHLRIELRGTCERPFHVERDGEAIWTCPVRLWAPDDYLAAYSLASGAARSFDPYLRAVSRTSRVALLMHRSLEISATADEEHPLDGTYLLRIFGSGVPTGTAISCDGETLWVSEPQAEGRRVLDGGNAELVLDSAGASWGGEADLVLSNCPDGFEPQRAIVGGQALVPGFDGKAWRFPGFRLLPGMDNLRRRGRLDGLSGGERASLAAHAAIAHAPLGAAFRTTAGWTPADPEAPFLCGDRNVGVLWASLPKMVGDADWTVFEGCRPVVAHLESGTRLDRRLFGLGEPLCIEQRRFNRTSGTTWVSDMVLDTGIVLGSERSAGSVRILTATPLDLTRQHRAVGIYDGGVRLLPPVQHGDGLRFAADGDIELVCLMHGDTWLGTAYLTDDIGGALTPFLDAADGWKEHIGLALAARLPLLARRTRTRVASRMQADGGVGLTALCRLPEDRIATHLIGRMLVDWQPSPKLAAALVDAFLHKLDDGGLRPVTVLGRMAEAAPIAAIRTLGLGLGSRTRGDRARVLEALSRGLAPKDVARSQTPGAEEKLLALAMEATRFDFNFLASKSAASIASLAWAAVTSPERDEPNLDTCMTIAPVRRWIASHLVARLTAALT